MALNVAGTFATPYGTSVSGLYWRWVGLGIDVTSASATVTLYAYVNEAAFTGGKRHVDQHQVVLGGADFWTVATTLETPGNPGLSAVIYNYCKAHVARFSAATDG